ncbi:MAG: EamA family transporter [Candidatus Methylumidiphilus sp.]
MKISNIIQIILTILLLSVGQILFKMVADKINPNHSIVSTITNPLLILALAVYGVATLLWIFSLRNVPLSLAYPFAALAFVFVPVMAHFALSEPLKAKTFYGFILILAGVTISTIEF